MDCRALGFGWRLICLQSTFIPQSTHAGLSNQIRQQLIAGKLVPGQLDTLPGHRAADYLLPAAVRPCDSAVDPHAYLDAQSAGKLAEVMDFTFLLHACSCLSKLSALIPIAFCLQGIAAQKPPASETSACREGCQFCA